MLSLEESEYPPECDVVLRRLRLAMAEEQLRRDMEGEDLLLRDSILSAQRADRLARQAEQERQRAERAEQRTERAEQRTEQAEQREARQQAQFVRHLHGLGQSFEEIARALSVDTETVRRILSE